GFLDVRPRVGYFYTGKTGSELLTEKVKKNKVKDFQSVHVVVKEDTSLYDAISTMFLGDVGKLFVVHNHSCLIGVLFRKDLLTACLSKQELTSVPMHIIMT